jgi:hypothetical protein
LKRKIKVGGADGIRTHDLLDAIEARSQLRHGPTGDTPKVYHTPRGKEFLYRPQRGLLAAADKARSELSVFVLFPQGALTMIFEILRSRSMALNAATSFAKSS